MTTLNEFSDKPWNLRGKTAQEPLTWLTEHDPLSDGHSLPTGGTVRDILISINCPALNPFEKHSLAFDKLLRNRMGFYLLSKLLKLCFAVGVFCLQLIDALLGRIKLREDDLPVLTQSGVCRESYDKVV